MNENVIFFIFLGVCVLFIGTYIYLTAENCDPMTHTCKPAKHRNQYFFGSWILATICFISAYFIQNKRGKTWKVENQDYALKENTK